MAKVRALMEQARHAAPERIADCPACGDAGFRPAGEGRGVVECECRRKRRVRAALARVEKRFWAGGQPPRLASLTARRDLVTDAARAARIGEQQAAAIEVMRREPLASYFFAGPADCGKTHLAYALYVHAAENTTRRVWAGSAIALMKQYQDMETGAAGEDGKPFVAELLPGMLAGHEWTILLDEVAYVRPTAFRHERFFDLIDAIWKGRHQLICTSNLRLDALERKWDEISGGNGAAMVKRLSADAHRVGFF